MKEERLTEYKGVTLGQEQFNLILDRAQLKAKLLSIAWSLNGDDDQYTRARAVKDILDIVTGDHLDLGFLDPSAEARALKQYQVEEQLRQRIAELEGIKKRALKGILTAGN